MKKTKISKVIYNIYGADEHINMEIEYHEVEELRPELSYLVPNSTYQ